MYTGWRTLWQGLAKNTVDTLGGPVTTLVVAFAAVALGWAAVVIPLIDAAALARGVDYAWLALVVGAGRLGRGARIACRGDVLFSHSFLVWIAVSPRLHRQRDHGR